jgi:hypothetical protein
MKMNVSIILNTVNEFIRRVKLIWPERVSYNEDRVLNYLHKNDYNVLKTIYNIKMNTEEFQSFVVIKGRDRR